VFTGLIEDLGRVREVRGDAAGATLAIDTTLAEQIGDGDSVAVNGVCLTATELRAGGFSAQAMNETLRRSSLGALAAGSAVNLELALRAGARLGGHIVQGHVDGTATVTAVREDGFARVVDFALEASAPDGASDGLDGQVGAEGDRRQRVEDAGRGGLARYLVEKGSVAIDGVSLTVSALRGEGFSVSLIPQTLRQTNLDGLRAGDRVNVEVDVLAKYVERLMEARA
jgi:riboflavin synthase